MRRRLLLGVAILFASGCDRDDTLTVYLVRHAEKDMAAQRDDPPLTADGKRRAEALVTALAGVTLVAAYATDTARTQQTVAPAAAARGLSVEILPARQVDAVIAKIRGHKGAVLVAGHSNTIPEIVKGLGVSDQVVIDDSAYGDLFVVRVSESGATLERRRF